MRRWSDVFATNCAVSRIPLALEFCECGRRPSFLCLDLFISYDSTRCESFIIPRAKMDDRLSSWSSSAFMLSRLAFAHANEAVRDGLDDLNTASRSNQSSSFPGPDAARVPYSISASSSFEGL